MKVLEDDVELKVGTLLTLVDTIGTGALVDKGATVEVVREVTSASKGISFRAVGTDWVHYAYKKRFTYLNVLRRK